MLLFSHVSVKTNTQHSLGSCCVVRQGRIGSSLFSSECTFDSRIVGRAGLVGLAFSLARMPPRLLCLCPLSHRLRHLLVRVAAVGESVVSGSDLRSKQRPLSFSVVTGDG